MVQNNILKELVKPSRKISIKKSANILFPKNIQRVESITLLVYKNS